MTGNYRTRSRKIVGAETWKPQTEAGQAVFNRTVRVAVEALKFVPEYRAAWDTLTGQFGRGAVLAALTQLRAGSTPSNEPLSNALLALNGRFSVSAGGPVDPEDPDDFPGDRIVPGAGDRWGTHRMGVFDGLLLPPDSATPEVVTVGLDLRMPISILSAGILELAHRRGVRTTRNPRHEHPWAEARGRPSGATPSSGTWAWKDAFALLRDQNANPNRPVARLARLLPGFNPTQPLRNATLVRRAQRMLAAAKQQVAAERERLKYVWELLDHVPKNALSSPEERDDYLASDPQAELKYMTDEAPETETPLPVPPPAKGKKSLRRRG